MTPDEPASGEPFSGEPFSAERPDTDDYDLLTYGEAGARLVELLAAERAALAALQAQVPPDAAAVRLAGERIALLQASAERYRQEAMTAEVFTRRFGTIAREDL